MPNCVSIHEIEVIKETNACYMDFQVSFTHKNMTIHGFLTSENILKATSRQTLCENLIQRVYLTKGDRILVKNGTNTKIDYVSNFVKIKFNLQDVNLSRINFHHSHNIIHSVNLIKQYQDLTVLNEDRGTFHVTPDQYINMRYEWEMRLQKFGSVEFQLITE